MNGAGVLLLGVLGLGLVVAIVVLTWRAQTKRREALSAFSRSRGWAFNPGTRPLPSGWSGTPFDEGRSKRIASVVTGLLDGLPVEAFDYTYVTDSSSSNGRSESTTHHYAVCALTLPTYLPRLSVSPENALTRMGHAIGLGSDIELESDEFNRAFTVRSTDPRFASDVLNARVMERLLAAERAAWRIDGNRVITWWGRPLDPLRLLSRSAMLRGVVEAVPGFVWRDHGVDPAAVPHPRPVDPPQLPGGSL